MYDRRLDAIVAAAETGSFTQAAARLHISTTALAKQVAAFEAECGLTLFERTRHGVTLTAAGESLVPDARAAMRDAHEALRRARRAMGEGDGIVRLGVSLLCPGRKVLDLWPRMHEMEPSLRLELEPVASLYDAAANVVGSLGGEVDMVQTGYSRVRWGGLCSALPLGEVPLAVDVARCSPLAGKRAIRVEDLFGMRVYALRHGSDGMDAFRDELAAGGKVEVVDVDDYDLGLFNECAEGGGALITSGAWSGLHPGMATVPLAEPRLASCALLYPKDPSAAVRRFVDALERAFAEARAAFGEDGR